MDGQRTGSAKKNLPYHNTLILHKSKNLTVKDQPEGICNHRNTAEGHGQGGQTGVQLPQHDRQGFKGVENTGGNWN